MEKAINKPLLRYEHEKVCWKKKGDIVPGTMRNILKGDPLKKKEDKS